MRDSVHFPCCRSIGLAIALGVLPVAAFAADPTPDPAEFPLTSTLGLAVSHSEMPSSIRLDLRVAHHD